MSGGGKSSCFLGERKQEDEEDLLVVVTLEFQIGRNQDAFFKGVLGEEIHTLAANGGADGAGF